MTKPFQPLLAYTIKDTKDICYPVYVSKKLDGIRCMVIDGVVYSRSMKPIRSKSVQELFGKEEFNGLDGEVLYGPWNDPLVFNKTSSTVMATDLKPEFSKSELRFAIFDVIDPDSQYHNRHGTIAVSYDLPENMIILEQKVVNNERELLDFESEVLEQGFEGIMVRSIDGRYKPGRSTQKEGIIGKLKRFSDDEALVIGFEERMTNTNEKVVNEIGRSQRSQALSGMVGDNTLGALICTCRGITFTMGSGFDDDGRLEVWNNKENYIGKLAKFKFFEVGMLNSFRFPIFLGWRDIDDIS